jgi:hypothetical protein
LQGKIPATGFPGRLLYCVLVFDISDVHPMRSPVVSTDGLISGYLNTIDSRSLIRVTSLPRVRYTHSRKKEKRRPSENSKKSLSTHICTNAAIVAGGGGSCRIRWASLPPEDYPATRDHHRGGRKEGRKEGRNTFAHAACRCPQSLDSRVNISTHSSHTPCRQSKSLRRPPAPPSGARTLRNATAFDPGSSNCTGNSQSAGDRWIAPFPASSRPALSFDRGKDRNAIASKVRDKACERGPARRFRDGIGAYRADRSIDRTDRTSVHGSRKGIIPRNDDKVTSTRPRVPRYLHRCRDTR